ncbi:MAG: hypothetical protein COA44_08880 [Arcobacter sp.]|nr:MAG: hypothetical protein COA44_08880 [Arcobacter sp.]
MYKLQKLSLQWNYDTDERMTIAQSPNSVLEAFFSMKDWEFVRHGFNDLWEEIGFELDDKRIEFEGKYVHLYVNENKTSLEKQEYIRIISQLYDLMIIGANEDHHNVRYEMWWQDFTEINYKIKCKIEMEENIQSGSE